MTQAFPTNTGVQRFQGSLSALAWVSQCTTGVAWSLSRRCPWLGPILFCSSKNSPVCSPVFQILLLGEMYCVCEGRGDWMEAIWRKSLCFLNSVAAYLLSRALFLVDGAWRALSFPSPSWGQHPHCNISLERSSNKPLSAGWEPRLGVGLLVPPTWMQETSTVLYPQRCQLGKASLFSNKNLAIHVFHKKKKERREFVFSPMTYPFYVIMGLGFPRERGWGGKWYLVGCLSTCSPKWLDLQGIFSSCRPPPCT